MSNKLNHSKIVSLTTLGVLAALIVVMAFTPLGYLKVGALSITFLMIPVVIGAIIVGPVGGAVLGGVFGLTSFIQCFGMDAFGTALADINIFYCAIMCFVSRILAGFLAGVVFRLVDKIDKSRVVSFGAASLTGALLNTVFFVFFLIVLFGRTEFVKSFGDSVIAIIAALVSVNSIIESVVCLFVGAAISKALVVFLPKKAAE